MPSFTTRVELHSASYSDYNALHSAMERSGFARTIRATEGTWYHLPLAEYNFEGNAAIADVLNAASAAAATTGKTFAVLVSESPSRMWQNLQRVQ